MSLLFCLLPLSLQQNWLEHTTSISSLLHLCCKCQPRSPWAPPEGSQDKAGCHLCYRQRKAKWEGLFTLNKLFNLWACFALHCWLLTLSKRLLKSRAFPFHLCTLSLPQQIPGTEELNKRFGQVKNDPTLVASVSFGKEPKAPCLAPTFLTILSYCLS